MADRVRRLGQDLADFPSDEVDTALNKLYAAVGEVLEGRGTKPVPPVQETESVPEVEPIPSPDEVIRYSEAVAAGAGRTKPVPRPKPVPKSEEQQAKAEERKAKALEAKEKEQAELARQYAEAKKFQTIYRYGEKPHRVALHQYKTEGLMVIGGSSLTGKESYVFIRESLKAPRWKYSRIVIFRYLLKGGKKDYWMSDPSGWALTLGGTQYYPDIPTDMKALRRVIGANHPDKNANADVALYKRAVDQLAMVRAAIKR